MQIKCGNCKKFFETRFIEPFCDKCEEETAISFMAKNFKLDINKDGTNGKV